MTTGNISNTISTNNMLTSENEILYYNLSPEETLKSLNSSKKGLTDEKTKKRLIIYGPNKIEKKEKFKTLKIFLRQFKNPLVIILIIALIVSLFVGEKINGIVIGAIVVFNAALGFHQEYKAEKTIELLKKFISPTANVFRDGTLRVIKSEDIVPGDILQIEAGDRITADGRIIESFELRVDESVLTGESVPVHKNKKNIDGIKPIAERENVVFSGTTIASGRAKIVVTKTGRNTEFGGITTLVETIGEETTTLQKKLEKLGEIIGIGAIFVCFLVFLIGIIYGMKLSEMFLVGVSLAVSVIPEGLAAVTTICLALSARKMIKNNAIIRKLGAIETLGSVNVICADKTGTITKNEMTVTDIYTNGKMINITGEGFDVKGDFLYENRKIDMTEIKEINRLFDIGTSCNDSSLAGVGDPTEIALLVAAAKAGVRKDENRINEVPFTSERKYMATVHKRGGKNVIYVKGAVEEILRLCDYIEIDGKRKRIKANYKNEILRENNKMAKNALRVLGMAYKDGSDIREINKLIFVGLMGMIDDPRKGIKEAIDLCRKAGIKTIMITGDNKLTARAIAEKIGIKGETVEGKELEEMSDEKLKHIVKNVSIYARCDPSQKIKILHALKENGKVVAMTGDGVNDAPALKKAAVGVAMGIKGTDVSREASDIILMDDNFATIVKAIEEGRITYDNIKKFVKFLLTSNIDEIAIILFAIIIGLPLPYLPVQILWINLVTDSMPALALSTEPGEKDVMVRKPRKKDENILTGLAPFIIIGGLLAFLVTTILYSLEYISTENLTKARTIAVTCTVFYELFFVFTCRSDKTLKEIGIFSNKKIVYAVLIVAILQIIMIYSSLNNYLYFVPLDIIDWVTIIVFSSIGVISFEGWKYLKKKGIKKVKYEGQKIKK